MFKLLTFLREVRQEFNNITWPKREALIQLTVVVISISVVISLILGGFDYLFTNSFATLGNLKSQVPVTAPVAIPTFSFSASPSAQPQEKVILTTTKINNLKK